MKETLQRYISIEILRDPARPVNDDEPLITSGLIDSFHLVDLALFVEGTFGVKIEDAELSAAVFDTLEELIHLIEIKRSGAPA